MKRSDKRNQFLTDVFTTAIENGGVGWFTVDEYRWESVPLGEAYAVVTPYDEPAESHRIDVNTIAKGLGIIREAVIASFPHTHGNGEDRVLANAATGERLYLAGSIRDALKLADRTNGDEGDFDAIGALAVVECALFGKVTYA